MTRVLTWEGCVNVRDLGGLPTEDGCETRRGAVVRADNVRRLSDAGWQALVDHGMRTVVDLRWPEELALDPPRDVPIEVVHVSLFGELEEAYWRDLDRRLAHLADRVDVNRESNLELLELHRARFAEAVTAVADAEGGVVVHCASGKDRTGLLSALLLRLAGVAPGVVADDYDASNANLDALTELWRAEAPDDDERARRVRLNDTPRDAMLGILAELDRRHGGVRAYLRASGVADAALDRAAARLR